MTDPNIEAVKAALLTKLGDLRRARVALRKQMIELRERDHEIDREYADIRATARLFKIDIPLDDKERPYRLFRTIRGPDGTWIRQRVDPEGKVLYERELPHGPGDGRHTAQTAPPSPVRRPERPPIKEIVLSRLKEAGEEGTEAVRIRNYIVRVYGGDIHEKTVGMTLYRLKKEGLVRRDGNTWFFVPQSADTENPGAATPGPINSDDE